MGATGHVGSAVTRKLLQHKESVTVIVRNEEKAQTWEEQGAEIAVADVLNINDLRQAFNKGDRLFLLNPPAAPNTDTVAEERRTIKAILEALDGSGIEKVVAQSTYGAQPGNDIGDLGTLYEMEQGLKKLDIPAVILRAAYYMSNWDMSLETAEKEGIVHTLYPTDFKIPMVAPEDIGQTAARLLKESAGITGVQYIEGPARYSPNDVAAAFEEALHKPVKAEEIPKDQWLPALAKIGFSPKAAVSMAAMTESVLVREYGPSNPIKGRITLQEYIAQLVNRVPTQAPALSSR
jgi:uncharacterized protein YbjT (DUF2867 family)